jgi:hypothetical protein
VFREFARNAMYYNRPQFQALQWTAHGVKKWPSVHSLRYVERKDNIIAAMPFLLDIVDVSISDALYTQLLPINIHYFEQSISFTRDLRRVPIKPNALTVDEKNHMSTSYDGFNFFFPVDIYTDNIASSEGLLQAFKRVQLLDGFGLHDHIRNGLYSMMVVDIAVFWSLFLILYSFTSLAPILHDLFLCLGSWHTYQHAHKLVWAEFRSYFLGSAFFCVFPDRPLWFAPHLEQSVTFFSWLRLSYPAFRPKLIKAIRDAKRAVLQSQLDYIEELRIKSFKRFESPAQARYVHLFNLFYLFEYVLPVVHDYGAALKLNSPALLDVALSRLFRFYLSCKTEGMRLYRRGLYCSHALMKYWQRNELPISKLLRDNHTIFSEETGELSLAILVQSLPSNHGGDYEQTRRHWQQSKLRSAEAKYIHDDLNMHTRLKHHRKISKPRSYFIFMCSFRLIMGRNTMPRWTRIIQE